MASSINLNLNCSFAFLSAFVTLWRINRHEGAKNHEGRFKNLNPKL